MLLLRGTALRLVVGLLVILLVLGILLVLLVAVILVAVLLLHIRISLCVLSNNVRRKEFVQESAVLFNHT